MKEKSFSRYSVVRAKIIHNRLGIPEGKLLAVCSFKSPSHMFRAFGVDQRLSKSNFEVVSDPFKTGSIAICINPTATLTEGGEYRTYKSEYCDEISVINDRGVLIDTLRSRFSAPINN